LSVPLKVAWKTADRIREASGLMGKIAVLSDIHANLEAFRAVLDDIASLSVDRVFCLGDIVGYNADPSACIMLCRENDIFCIMGNHDAAVCGKMDVAFFNKNAAAAIQWTRKQLSREDLMFLNQLPGIHAVNERFLLLHGSLMDPDRYLIFKQDAEEDFKMMKRLYPDIQIAFFGHTHQPKVFACFLDFVTSEPLNSFTLQTNRRYLINPGSVGQPRNKMPTASYVIYNETTNRISFHHVVYDIDKAAGKILKAGLPKRLAERLFWGR